ncbi:Peptide-methionine (R)-S-oxide reductase MsrB [hydrothermal vent metagenome]|uniref:peptide-methionine (R)-S-oxide reductase n=1 Tax=hydrothermal vent metagenome TaxID=652676 RepID=A0A3B1A315_9ZZZZ
MTNKIRKTDNEWLQQLSQEQYQITRKHGTERAFTGEYHDCKDNGTYLCICCGAKLFGSDTKFDSGTGWPSFYQALAQNAVEETIDNSAYMSRTEVHCKTCDAHLGHVFPDGPQPSGLRYCINSASLTLEKK